VRRLHEQSDGWAAGLTLLVERARRGLAIDAARDPGAMQHVFAYFAEQLIANDFRADEKTLLELSFLPRVTPQGAHALTGDARAHLILERLHRRHLFTQRRAVGHGVSYELHALLRAYLQHRAGEAWNAEQRRDVLVRAAQVLESEGASADAVEIYRELGDWASLARSVVASAQALLGQGRHRTLLDWIQMLPEEIREAVPRVCYWKGSALATIAPREARAELEKAFAGFRDQGDRLGRVLAAAGIVYTYYLDMSHLLDMDPWVGELNAAPTRARNTPRPRSSCT
jgi:ATP/maltotriose-dependent transcriptional regulator MalT